MFGVDLDELTLGSSHKVPFIVRKIVEYIEENGRLDQALCARLVVYTTGCVDALLCSRDKLIAQSVHT